MDYKKETIRSYDKHALVFSEKFKDLMELHRRDEFSKFIKYLNGKDILDLGSGSGDHAVYFSKQGFNVKCIDLSSEMIKLCKNKGLNADVMDIEDLRFKEGSFDGIWAVTSLLHIPKANIKPILKKLNEILRDEGILYICLKEGKGEGFEIDENDPTTKRFFSYWSKVELIDSVSPFFDILEFKKIKPLERVFLQIFLKKKLI